MPADTEIGGHVAEGFEAVAEAFATNFRERGEVGAAVHATVDGVVVVDLWAGAADTAGRAWRPDTLVDVYSVGKALAATLVLQLVDAGRVGLDDPVATHWPAFAVGGKQHGTVRHLLCHRIGVPAIDRPLTDDDLFAFTTMTEAVAATVAWWPPGERHAYHTNTYGHLTGGLVHAVTGETPGSRWRPQAASIGADLHIGVPDVDLHRCADVEWAGDIPPGGRDRDEIQALIDQARTGDEAAMVLLGYVNPPGYSSMGVVNDRRWRQAEVPSTNCHASARGVSAFYRALLTGRLLSPATLAEATRTQSAGWCPVLGQDVTFGLGFQPWTEHRPLGRTPGAYGHFGTGGALGFADPDHDLAFGYVMNHVIPRWQSSRNRALVDALYTCL